MSESTNKESFSNLINVAPTDSSFNYQTAEEIITIENIHKTYLLGIEGVPALRGVNLTVYRGEFLVLYGTSGGGKTSLLNILGTIDTPTKGHVEVKDLKITARTKDRQLANLRLQSMGFVFQTFNLLPTMTAAENVEMPMILAGDLNRSERRERVNELLGQVGLAERRGHLPNMMSGGEQQRVTIARALANNPDVLLLDEPTGDLDTTNTNIVMSILLRMNKEDNKTLIMVTHDSNLKSFAHRAVFIRDGKLFREEIIPQDERARKLDELASILKDVAGGNSATRNTNHFATESTIHSRQFGHVGPADIRLEHKITEFRDPSEYKTYAAHTNSNSDQAARKRRAKLFAMVFGEPFSTRPAHQNQISDTATLSSRMQDSTSSRTAPPFVNTTITSSGATQNFEMRTLHD